MHDAVIRGGTIVDGNGTPPFTGDLAIDGDRISAVGGKVGPGNGPGWTNRTTVFDQSQFQWAQGADLRAEVSDQ